MAFRFGLFLLIPVPPEEYRDENVTLMMIMIICDGFDGDVHRLYEDSWQRELAVSAPCTGKLGTEDPLPLLWREISAKSNNEREKDRDAPGIPYSAVSSLYCSGVSSSSYSDFFFTSMTAIHPSP